MGRGIAGVGSANRFVGFRGWVRSSGIVGQQGFEELDGGDEVASTGEDREVDGVEIRLAMEAAGQIGSWMNRRMELSTTRTDECQLTVALLVGPG